MLRCSSEGLISLIFSILNGLYWKSAAGVHAVNNSTVKKREILNSDLHFFVFLVIGTA